MVGFLKFVLLATFLCFAQCFVSQLSRSAQSKSSLFVEAEPWNAEAVARNVVSKAALDAASGKPQASSAKETDIFKLEQEALEISAKFGASSVQARLAWEAVEEMNASGRGANAMLKNLDAECELSNSELCKDFNQAMSELEQLKQQGNPVVLEAAKSLAAENKKLLAENRRLKEAISAKKSTKDL